MSELHTLSDMLRNHTADPELAVQLGSVLTAQMMKHSELHAAFGNRGQNASQPAFLTQESAAAMDEQYRSSAAEAAAFLQGHGGTLIHDGLTASCILLQGEEPVIQYPEEVFRGPFGYDAAALAVSVLMGWCRGNALIEDAFQRDDFCDCCLDLISNLVDQVIWNYDVLYEELADVPEAGKEDFKRLYFEGMMPDLAAAFGLEILRVLSGDRSSPELEDISDPEKRKEAEKILLYVAENCIRERNAFYFGADFAAVIERAAREV